jgi:DNA polymerase-3 subunit beta
MIRFYQLVHEKYALSFKDIELHLQRAAHLGLPDPERLIQTLHSQDEFEKLSAILDYLMALKEIILAPAKNQIIFHTPVADLVSRLIDGQFPNYQQVLPSSHATRAVMEREEMLKAVRLSALIAVQSANVVKIGIPGDGATAVTISAAAEIGENEGEVDAAIEGDSTSIAFNARYLEQALGNMEGEQVALELNGPLSPGVLRPVGDSDYIHVIMPVRTAS